MSPTNLTTAAAASGMANVAAAVTITGLGYLVFRQARRIGRLNARLRQLNETGADIAAELHDAMAHNDELTVRVDELEDQQVRILNSWLEAS